MRGSKQFKWCNMSCSICVPNLKFFAAFIPNLLKGSKIYKFGPCTPTTPLGYNLSSLRWKMSWSICVLNLKCLAAPVPNLLKGAQKLQIWPLPVCPQHAPIWGTLSSLGWDMPWSRPICVPNLKFLHGQVPNLWKGSQNLQIWPMDPHHAPSMPLYRAAIFHADAVGLLDDLMNISTWSYCTVARWLTGRASD